MKRSIKISELKPFDMAEHLDSEQAIAEYLTIVLEENNPTELAHALGTVARARGMSQIANETGLSRESLYKGLSGERVPNSDTLFKVLQALGLRLTAVPI